MQPAMALSFTETFDGSTLDAARWTSATAGGAKWQVVDGHLAMQLGNDLGSWAGFSTVEAVTGDFSVTLDYRLVGWPADSKARLVLNSFNSDANQYAALRMSDRQYDTPYPAAWPPGHVYGEVYMASPTVLGYPTNDLAGTLKVQRSGNTLAAYYKLPDGSWFDLGAHYTAEGETDLPRRLGMGLFLPGDRAAPNVQVWVDNFSVNAVPEPATAALWLAGLGLATLVVGRRSAGVGRAG
jgi:hypothetical protein